MLSFRTWLAVFALLIPHEGLRAQNPGGFRILDQQLAGTTTASDDVVTAPTLQLARPPPFQTPQQRGESIHRRSQRLIAHYGSAARALGKVIDARGGDGKGADSRNSAALQTRAEIEAVVGPLTDLELRDIDHYLNTNAAAQNVLPIEADDWWITRTGKIFARQFVTVGMTGVTVAYTGVKWVDQTTGWSLGKLVGHDFNSPNTSKASWGEMGPGIAGAWVATYDPAPAPR